MSFDVIGDIHGHANTLEALLARLGYAPVDGTYRHPSRQAIFLGDFIDRGPHQRRVVEIVRRMVDDGAAHAVMGNHEFNAIAYHTADAVTGDYLRLHSEKNAGQHAAFLAAYADSPADHAEVIDWFRTLPLWLDLGPLRVVHACWDAQLVARIQAAQRGGNGLTDNLLHEGSRRGTWQFEAVETLLKGKEIPLQPGFAFHDKDGNERHHIRVRWWDGEARTYRAAYMGPESARTHIPDDEIVGDHLVDYDRAAPPVFIGHYWLEGEPRLLAPNIACLDYSVAKPGGMLVAYRWNGEAILRDEGFVWVDRVE